MKFREKTRFDRDWKFHLGDFSRSDPPNVPTYFWPRPDEPVSSLFDDSQWQPVHLPHDWLIETFSPSASTRSTGYNSGGVGWYRKHFQLSPDDAGRAPSIEFDGIYRDATVWLNGQYLGHHPSGYTSFRLDITDAAQFDAENVLTVRVDSSRFEGWWYYEGAGIYRHVWLVNTDPLHVAHWGTQAIAELEREAGDCPAALTINTTVRNDGEAGDRYVLTSRVVAPDGAVVAESESEEAIGPRETAHIAHRTAVQNPELWSLETPALYRLHTTIQRAGSTADEYVTNFGIRTVRFHPDDGFFLNGRPVKIKGTNNHQDHGGVGVALPDRLHEHRVERLLSLGSNAYRCAHHPPAPEFLDACDRLGMMVVDEARTFATSDQALEELRSIVLRDRNHPCIILWSIGNEESLVQHRDGASAGRVAKRMTRLVRDLDPSRPVTLAMNAAFSSPPSEPLDVVGFNYSPEVYDAYHSAHPERPLVGTEMAAVPQTRGSYANDPARYHYTSYDGRSWGADSSHQLGWAAVASRPFMSGGFIWAGFDYHGEGLPTDEPATTSHFGILDICGFPKDGAWFLQAAWKTEPVLHVFPHWNWPGREGEEIEVWCYSNCEEVELFLNGRSLGAQRMPPLSHLEWKVPYQPGVLAARGTVGGEVVAITEVVTAGAPHTVRLEPDRASIEADGRDLSLVTVSVVDAEGRVVPTADNEVAFSTTEGGRVIGVANGDPSSREPEKGSRRRAFRGLCLAIVQADDQPGAVTLTATSPGLLPASVSLDIRPETRP